jgi:hypothetical protein
MALHKDLTGADLHVNKVHADTHVVAGTDPLVLAESQVTDLTTDLAAKAATVHAHVKADVTDFPASLPASDVSEWAKAGTKPSYAYSEITTPPTLGTASEKNIPATGNAAATEVVYGSDTRLVDARTPASHSHALTDLANQAAESLLANPTGSAAAPSALVVAEQTLVGRKTSGVIAALGGADALLAMGITGLSIAQMNAIQALVDDKATIGKWAKSPSIEIEFLNTLYAPLSGFAIASGTANMVSLASTANHPGILTISSSTSPNSGYVVGASNNLNHYLIAGGEVFEVIFEVDTTTNTTVRLGFSDNALPTASVDGVNLQIVGTTVTGVARSNNSETDTADTVTITQGVWYRAKLVLNANATLATFTLFTCADGLPVTWVRNTIATNIPTGAGRHTVPMMQAITSDTAAAKSLCSLDYARYDFNRVLVR